MGRLKRLLRCVPVGDLPVVLARVEVPVAQHDVAQVLRREITMEQCRATPAASISASVCWPAHIFVATQFKIKSLQEGLITPCSRVGRCAIRLLCG